MNKFTRIFLFFTFGTVLLISVYAFSPMSFTDNVARKTNDKFISSNLMTDKRKAESEILLGQTKYYQAIMKGNHLKIVESTEPALSGGTPDVTFEVTRETCDTLGVYYDNVDEQGNILPSGMIRLIGRYWKEGEAFKVRLTAKRMGIPLLADLGSSRPITIRESSNIASVVVEVKPPSELGTVDNTVTDVFGKSINIDDLIIKYAGENGIPPQLIKAQMDQESSFQPKWRYEPFKDAATDSGDNIFKNNMFLITQNSMGGPFPTSHENVQDTDYMHTQVKISKYLIDHWFSIYVQRGGANAPDVILGSTGDPYDLTQRWNDKWQKSLKKVKNPKEVAHNYVESLITDPTQFPGNDFDRLAQTRIWSSYGFTQLLYAMAITDGKFNKETDGRYAPTGTQYMDKKNASKYPEMLNEEDILMPRYCDRLLRNLNLLFPGRIPESEWKGKRGGVTYEGFEACWKASLYYYNTDPKYARDVWSKAQNYLPQQ